MFHDPSLERTTNGTGLIKEQPWKGVIENFRTTKKPHQQLPTFKDVCDLLMRPENKHVKLNIDIKPENDPEVLFKLMKQVVSSYPSYATDLSPRLILGLWHPCFLAAALKHVPSMRRIHIGGSPWAATTYFWKHCDGFSMSFPSLIGTDGQEFLRRAERDGKDVFVWTVNRKDEMVEATRWGVKAILTDKTAMLQDVREGMTADFPQYRRNEVGMFFRWSTLRYYTFHQWCVQSVWIGQLEKRAGVTFKEAWKTAEHLDVPETVVPMAPAPASGGVVQQEVPVEVHDESGAGASSQPSSNTSSPGFVAVNEKSEVPPMAPPAAAIPVAAA
ncbi:PLC-like phosphodiesterase [Jaminaea rosea]|uniref:PLC-like phosphodiesterase n=1 Tax=Jaminaea rosea TaxID=1569628 RepID=A0A316UMQ3_9BASI|nr:PLC-like phosphodiesterase [Jaminaea rosea]PWN26510.1 PLC-like phosphodiesterase [Jaminaea rosea]